MAQTSEGKGSTVTFQGKSGTRYHFQAWPMETRFKSKAGIYIVTKRECLNRNYPTMAAHRCLAIGQTADFAASVLSKAELKKLAERGANCICVYAVADEASRLQIEQDLIEGNEQWGGELHYLFRAPVADRAPGTSELSDGTAL
jgi:hypothetical protein